MNIKETCKTIEEVLSFNYDKKDFVKNLLSKYNEIHLNDLDLSLIIIYLGCSFLLEENFKKTIINSDFCPESFVNNDSLNNATLTFSESEINAIGERELISDFVLDNRFVNDNSIAINRDLIIKLDVENCISFLLQQNGHDLIHHIFITNISKMDYNDVTIAVSYSTGIIQTNDIFISLLKSGETTDISKFVTKFNVPILSSITESINDSISFDVFTEEHKKIATISKPVEILTFDSYGGDILDRSLIAGFVTPNDIMVKELDNKFALEISSLNHGNGSFVEYQSGDKNDVLLQLNAIYNVLLNEGIGYMTPPASFLKFGQRIRMPFEVLKNKRGTCLDLSILFAACMENVGLKAVIIFTSKHAFVGCHLENTCNKNNESEDLGGLYDDCQKGIDKFRIIETTLCCAGNSSSFDQACISAEKTLELEFKHGGTIVDISTCRINKIQALPLMFKYENSEVVPSLIEEVDNLKTKQHIYENNSELLESEAIKNKFDLWERKLLNLGLRNPLVNLKQKGEFIKFVNIDSQEFSDYLFKGKQNQDFNLRVIENSVESSEELFNHLKTTNDLGIYISTSADKILKPMYRESRRSLEECGSSNIYICIGVIDLSEKLHSKKMISAPLILVPVELKMINRNTFKIHLTGDDLLINSTILEYIKQNFDLELVGLNEVPLNANENPNIQLIFNTIRNKIKGMPNWAVRDVVYLAKLSFAKSVMWNDIKFRQDDLMKNPVVKGLVTNLYEGSRETCDINKLDDDFSAANIAAPLPYDSSQLKAIIDCAEGRSFVLEGPPGTGKSQTIANMIINTMYKGKTVLFVAEKQTALDVVKNRLDELSLGNFAIEFDGVKKSKEGVVNQLDKRLSITNIQDSKEYSELSKEITNKRNELNDLTKKMHRETNYYLSLYDALSLYESTDIKDVQIKFTEEYLVSLNTNEVNKDKEYLSNLAIYSKKNGIYRNNDFQVYTNRNYSIELRNDLKRLLIKSKDDVFQMRSVLLKLDMVLPEKIKDTKLYIDGLCNCYEDVINKQPFNVESLTDNNFTENLTHINDLIISGIRFQKLNKDMLQKYNKNIFSFDTDNSRFVIEKANNSNVFLRLFKKHKIVKKLRKYAIYPKDINRNNILHIIDEIDEHNEKDKNNIIFNKNYLRYFTSFGCGENYEKIFVIFRNTKQINDDMCNINIGKRGEFINWIINVDNHKLLSDINSINIEFIKDVDLLEKVYKFDFSNTKFVEKYLESFGNILELFVNRIDYIDSWTALLVKIDEGINTGLKPLIDAYRNNEISDDDLLNLYNRNISFQLINNIIKENHLSGFQGFSADEIIRLYNEKVEKYSTLTCVQTAAVLSKNTQSRSIEASPSSDLGILKKFIKSKGRGKSIRHLISEIPSQIHQLFPCFMMSPLSCAQYLTTDTQKFDVVIFDEASQMPTSEAVGSMSRGKSIIVVGDSKQMPPTSFFTTKINEDLDEDADLGDLESVLDDCNVIGLPKESLLWHYRSRHESLIEFSNHNFYDDTLYTFPSPDETTSKVSFIKCSGIYDGGKGKSHTNEVEADAIVKEIGKRFADPILCKKSIGVVTFSEKQMDLINDKVDELFDLHPEYLEQNIKNKEQLFIKNLETVQGDERDVILFSVCYGPDTNGKISMNLGPIINQGGERRLNVAFSRSKEEMIVFSSMEPLQINCNKSGSKGVRLLHDFLMYAKNGSDCIIYKDETKCFKDEIIKRIASDLNILGYKVNTNVGHSKFKIDIGIFDSIGQTYIMGIVCDGHYYSETPTSRDRNVVQTGVLKRLNWNIMRIWALDYYNSPNKIINEIIANLEKCRERPSIVEKTVKDERYLLLKKLMVSEPKIVNSKINYDKCVISNCYFDGENYMNLEKCVRKIIDVESPVSINTLKMRTSELYNVSKCGPRMTRQILRCIKNIDHFTNYSYENMFFWKKEGMNIDLKNYRNNNNRERDILDIPKEEIIVVINDIILNQGGMNIDDLIRETYKKLGYTRTGDTINKVLCEVIEYGVNARHCLEKSREGKIWLVTE